jgi:hypothetical protein
MAAASSRNGTSSPAGRKNPTQTTPIHTTSPAMIVRRLPSERATRPNASAPKKATNCTSRMVAISTEVSKPSSFSPYTDAEVITVWMPSL